MRQLKAIIILGPTSSGKSDLAIDLVRELENNIGKQSEIISVDSRQIYKDMNLGTGKVEGEWELVNNEVVPPPRRPAGLPSTLSTSLPVSPPRGTTSSLNKQIYLYKNIPHYLIDFQDPRTHSQEEKKYTVVNFQKDALKLIKDISNRNKIPILVGGTGFWISSLVDNPQFPKVKPNKALRKKLEKESAESLFRKLKKQDLITANRIDSQNKYRLIRALEICNKLGTVPKTKKNPQKNIKFLQIGLDYPVEKLGKKIKKRLASRWTNGMIAEVKKIKKDYQMNWEEIQAFGLAYYWIPLYLQNKLRDNQGNIIADPTQAKKELLDRVYFAEKNYAKRQRTWFKRDKRIIWTTDLKKIVELSKKFL